MSKPEVQARHGVMNGSPQPPIEPPDASRSRPVASNSNPYAAAKDAEHALNLARVEARQCRDRTMAARTAFGKALADWNAAGPVWTQEMQARAFIAQSNADRAARAAAAGGAIVHPGITRVARAMSGGNMRRGGGAAFRRGPAGAQAYSKAEAMTLEARRLQAAAAARAKLPSEK